MGSHFGLTRTQGTGGSPQGRGRRAQYLPHLPRGSWEQRQPPSRGALGLSHRARLSLDFAPREGAAVTRFPALGEEKKLGLGI